MRAPSVEREREREIEGEREIARALCSTEGKKDGAQDVGRDGAQQQKTHSHLHVAKQHT